MIQASNDLRAKNLKILNFVIIPSEIESSKSRNHKYL